MLSNGTNGLLYNIAKESKFLATCDNKISFRSRHFLKNISSCYLWIASISKITKFAESNNRQKYSQKMSDQNLFKNIPETLLKIVFIIHLLRYLCVFYVTIDTVV